MNQPAVVGVSGAPKMAEKMAQFDAKKFAEMQGAGGKDNKKADKKKEQAPKKKEEKPKEAKKEEPKAEEAPAEPKKDKDPFAALPAGTPVMDEWKKMFSNNPEDVSMPWFWENFDHENYSIWFCEYMYP